MTSLALGCGCLLLSLACSDTALAQAPEPDAPAAPKTETESEKEDCGPWPWRFGLAVGAAQVHGKAFEDFMQNGRLGEVTLTGAWQPGPFGVELHFGSLTGARTIDGITSTYEANETRIGAVYEAAPLARGTSKFSRRFRLLGRLGILGAGHKLDITDGYVRLADDSDGSGAYAGLDAMLKIKHFRFGLRTSLSYQQVTFDTIDFDRKIITSDIQIGGEYAF